MAMGLHFVSTNSAILRHKGLNEEAEPGAQFVIPKEEAGHGRAGVALPVGGAGRAIFLVAVVLAVVDAWWYLLREGRRRKSVAGVGGWGLVVKRG
jgi:hypothetical protein